jgi:hypothetical protein
VLLGFSQWLMMNFSERRIHSAKILFATRYSLFAAVSRLADLPISRFADKFWLGRSLALP